MEPQNGVIGASPSLRPLGHLKRVIVVLLRSPGGPVQLAGPVIGAGRVSVLPGCRGYWVIRRTARV
jgi:hypothetical protein